MDLQYTGIVDHPVADICADPIDLDLVVALPDPEAQGDVAHRYSIAVGQAAEDMDLDCMDQELQYYFANHLHKIYRMLIFF